MNYNEWVNSFAEKVNLCCGNPDDPDMWMESWITKARGDYLDPVYADDTLKMLFEKGITEHLSSSSRAGCTVNVGFNPKEQKWYGWSHRAIYGFGIGSAVKKGHCAYHASNKEDWAEDLLNFHRDGEYHNSWNYEFGTSSEGEGVWLHYLYNDKVPNKKLRGTTNKIFYPYPEQWGKGEWVAKTLQDARQMAIDFANGVG